MKNKEITDKTGEGLEQMTPEQKELARALVALHLEVGASIVQDLSRKITAVHVASQMQLEQAQAQISSLSKEISILRQENERLRGIELDQMGHLGRMSADIANLRIENDSLREGYKALLERVTWALYAFQSLEKWFLEAADAFREDGYPTLCTPVKHKAKEAKKAAAYMGAALKISKDISSYREGEKP